MSRTNRAAERRRAEREAARARRREEERRAEAAARAREEARERERQEARRAKGLQEGREREEAERRRQEREAARRQRLGARRRQERRQAAKEQESREDRRQVRRTARESPKRTEKGKRRPRPPGEASSPTTRPRPEKETPSRRSPVTRGQEKPRRDLPAMREGKKPQEKRRAARPRDNGAPPPSRPRTAAAPPRARRPRPPEKPRAPATGHLAAQKKGRTAERPRAGSRRPEKRSRTASTCLTPKRRPSLGPPPPARLPCVPADNPHPRPGAARLPSGVLSGHLPWLGVEGRFVVDERDRVRILRGVTLRGLERAAPHQGAFPVPVSPEEAALLRAWGGTAVRLPLAQDLALEGRGEAEGEDYLEALDAAVEVAAAAGLYTIVQLSLLSSVLPTHRGPGGASYDPPLPDPGSLDFWGILARRYAHEPAVLFQLFGSPHDPGPGDATARLLHRVTWPVWRNHLLAMLGELRREHPRAVVLAPGLAGDLSGFPLRYSDGSQVANLIYGLELSASGGQEAVRRLLQAGRREPAAVLGWRAVPLESRQVQALSPRLAQAGIHWLAAHWTEEPGALVSRQRGRLLPTPLGRAFQGALAAPLPAEFHLEPAARRQMFRLLPDRSS